LVAIAAAIDVHPAGADTTRQAIVGFAAQEAGVPYCDGGGGFNGPTVGATCGAPSFDCMSLAQYAVYQATGFPIDANGNNIYGGPDYTSPSADGVYIRPSDTVAEDEAALQPGDVVLFGGFSSYSYAHSGIWAGGDQVWDASGTKVQIVTFENLMSTYGNAYQGAMDYNNLSGTNPPSLSISTTSLPNATIGKKYVGGQLTASGGTTPLKWTVSGLPKGLKVSSKKGIINGSVRSSKSKPQAPGKYPLTITVTDSSNPKQQASRSLNLTLEAAS
jgi:hypothetical protein